MAFPQRLPVVTSDDGQWGDILNQFLDKEHYNNTGVDDPNNGMHQTVTLVAGTATAGTAPLKFNTGTLLTAPEVGALEFNDNGTNGKLYASYKQATTTTRLTVAAYDDASGATGDTYYRDANGNFKRLAVGTTNQVLTVTSGLPVWKTSTVASNYGIIRAIGAGIVNF
jgi:hypothetical protein